MSFTKKIKRNNFENIDTNFKEVKRQTRQDTKA